MARNGRWGPREHPVTVVMENSVSPAAAAMGTRTVARLVRERAVSSPHLVALRHKDLGIWQETTWSRYWEQVLLAAHGLLSLGVDTADRVSIHSEDRPEWVILDVATVAIRGITVGLYPTNPVAEVRYLLSDSGSRVHLAEDQEQADKLMEVIDTLPDLEKVIHLSLIHI